MGQLLVAAVFVLADETGDFQPAHLLHQQYVQLAVGGVGFGDGVEAAAVEPAVAHTDKGLLAVDGFAVDLHHIMLANALYHIHHRGGSVGTEAVQQRQPFIAGNVRADPGIQTHGADVQGEVIVALDQIESDLVRIHQPIQVEEGLGFVKHLGKVVAAAAGEHGNGGVIVACHTADHLVQGKTIVLNLETANRDVARRLIDFLSGVAYANQGSLKRVANSTFIITPYNVNVSGDLIDELENSGMFFQS